MSFSNTSRCAGDREHVHSEFLDDSELVASLQLGCEKCFETLFTRYWKLAFAISWKILRQHTEAEDVVQDVFLAIYLQPDKYDSARGSVKTWIAQFAYYKALMKRKYLQSKGLTDLDEHNAVESALSKATTVQCLLERSALVEQYLRTLNPRQRRTVELIHFDGYTLLEAATVLQESLANTRNLYYRGMKVLRSQLGNSKSLAAKNEESSAKAVGDAATAPFILGRPL